VGGLDPLSSELMAMRRTSWIDHRINDEAAMVCLSVVRRCVFFGCADWHDGGSPHLAKASITSTRGDAAMPGSALIVIEPELVFGGLKTVLIASDGSTATRVSMAVPAGTKCEEARSSSAIRRRISRPRVHKPSFALLNCPASNRLVRDSTNHAASPFVPSLPTAFQSTNAASRRCPAVQR